MVNGGADNQFLLDANSELHKYLTNIQIRIGEYYKLSSKQVNDRPLHVEICNKTDNEEVRRKAFDELMHCKVDVNDPNNYKKLGCAFVLSIGIINGRNRHITLTFGNYDQNELRKFIEY